MIIKGHKHIGEKVRLLQPVIKKKKRQLMYKIRSDSAGSLIQKQEINISGDAKNATATPGISFFHFQRLFLKVLY